MFSFLSVSMTQQQLALLGLQIFFFLMIFTFTSFVAAIARLTSADIEDGKVEYDADTNSTITYKKIPKGYQQIITIPQPNGTMKTQTKTFYDPVPVPADEIEEHQKKTTKITQMDSRKVTDKSVALSNPNTTMIVRKIPNGREEVYTTINADGTKSIQIKTFYDAEEVEVSETTEIEEEVPGDRRIITKQRVPKQQSIQETTQLVDKKTKKTQEQVQQQLVQKQQQDIQQKSVKKFEQETHEEVKFRSETTVEQSRRVSQSTEFSGKSVTKKSNVEEQNIQAITDKKEKKKKTKQAPPPPIEDKPGQKTTVVQKKIPGGTEYHYTTVMEDGRTVTSVKTIYEQEEVEMTDEEIKKYKKQLKEAEKHKDVTESKKLPSKKGTKEVVPGENPGEVTTVETVRIEGGTEYRYTTVTADGVVKKSSKTVYDPVPVEGEEDEEEIIEEYEEEVIEPGETITETYTSTKSLSVKEHQEEIVHKKKGKKLKN